MTHTDVGTFHAVNNAMRTSLGWRLGTVVEVMPRGHQGPTGSSMPSADRPDHTRVRREDGVSYRLRTVDLSEQTLTERPSDWPFDPQENPVPRDSDQGGLPAFVQAYSETYEVLPNDLPTLAPVNRQHIDNYPNYHYFACRNRNGGEMLFTNGTEQHDWIRAERPDDWPFPDNDFAEERAWTPPERKGGSFDTMPAVDQVVIIEAPRFGQPHVYGRVTKVVDGYFDVQTVEGDLIGSRRYYWEAPPEAMNGHTFLAPVPSDDAVIFARRAIRVARAAVRVGSVRESQLSEVVTYLEGVGDGDDLDDVKAEAGQIMARLKSQNGWCEECERWCATLGIDLGDYAPPEPETQTYRVDGTVTVTVEVTVHISQEVEATDEDSASEAVEWDCPDSYDVQEAIGNMSRSDIEYAMSCSHDYETTDVEEA